MLVPSRSRCRRRAGHGRRAAGARGLSASFPFRSRPSQGVRHGQHPARRAAPRPGQARCTGRACPGFTRLVRATVAGQRPTGSGAALAVVLTVKSADRSPVPEPRYAGAGTAWARPGSGARTSTRRRPRTGPSNRRTSPGPGLGRRRRPGARRRRRSRHGRGGGHGSRWGRPGPGSDWGCSFRTPSPARQADRQQAPVVG